MVEGSRTWLAAWQAQAAASPIAGASPGQCGPLAAAKSSLEGSSPHSSGSGGRPVSPLPRNSPWWWWRRKRRQNPAEQVAAVDLFGCSTHRTVWALEPRQSLKAVLMSRVPTNFWQSSFEKGVGSTSLEEVSSRSYMLAERRPPAVRYRLSTQNCHWLRFQPGEVGST